MALGLCLIFALASADESVKNGVLSRLKEDQTELDQIESKIKKQNKKISALGSKETSVLKTLSAIEKELNEKEKELRNYNWNVGINKKKIKRLTQNIAQAEQAMAKQKEWMGKRLRTIYKEGNYYPIKLLFSADNMIEFVQRVKFMEIVAAYDASLFKEYDEKLLNWKIQKTTLENARNDLIRLQKAAISKSAEIKQKKEARLKFLHRLRKEKSMSIRARKELAEASENLNQIILKLEKKLELGQDLNFADQRGHLSLPVPGTVINSFGEKRDKQYDSYIVYNGINIKTKKGTPVRAIYEGQVLYSGFLEGYGNLIIIGHGDKYHSLYGHLEEKIATIGKRVRKGQIIGLSGDKGSLFGETLYFELRHMGQAIEPTGWFHVANK